MSAKHRKRKYRRQRRIAILEIQAQSIQDLMDSAPDGWKKIGHYMGTDAWYYHMNKKVNGFYEALIQGMYGDER